MFQPTVAQSARERVATAPSIVARANLDLTRTGRRDSNPRRIDVVQPSILEGGRGNGPRLLGADPESSPLNPRRDPDRVGAPETPFFRAESSGVRYQLHLSRQRPEMVGIAASRPGQLLILSRARLP